MRSVRLRAELLLTEFPDNPKARQTAEGMIKQAFEITLSKPQSEPAFREIESLAGKFKLIETGLKGGGPLTNAKAAYREAAKAFKEGDNERAFAYAREAILEANEVAAPQDSHREQQADAVFAKSVRLIERIAQSAMDVVDERVAGRAVDFFAEQGIQSARMTNVRQQLLAPLSGPPISPQLRNLVDQGFKGQIPIPAPPSAMPMPSYVPPHNNIMSFLGLPSLPSSGHAVASTSEHHTPPPPPITIHPLDDLAHGHAPAKSPAAICKGIQKIYEQDDYDVSDFQPHIRDINRLNNLDELHALRGRLINLEDEDIYVEQSIFNAIEQRETQLQRPDDLRKLAPQVIAAIDQGQIQSHKLVNELLEYWQTDGLQQIGPDAAPVIGKLQSLQAGLPAPELPTKASVLEFLNTVKDKIKMQNIADGCEYRAHLICTEFAQTFGAAVASKHLEKVWALPAPSQELAKHNWVQHVAPIVKTDQGEVLLEPIGALAPHQQLDEWQNNLNPQSVRRAGWEIMGAPALKPETLEDGSGLPKPENLQEMEKYRK